MNVLVNSLKILNYLIDFLRKDVTHMYMEIRTQFGF